MKVHSLSFGLGFTFPSVQAYHRSITIQKFLGPELLVTEGLEVPEFFQGPWHARVVQAVATGKFEQAVLDVLEKNVSSRQDCRQNPCGGPRIRWCSVFLKEFLQMTKTRLLVVLAGAALSVAPAVAQNANLDKDRAYAAELVADAGSRASLLQGGGGAGFDGSGFNISDGTGNNVLYVGGAAQFRYTADFRDDEVNDTDGDGEDDGANNDFTHGFSTPNTRIWTWGHVWSKDLTYKIRLYTNDGGDITLEDAWGEYAFEGGLAFRWGQFKLPLLREENIESEHQLLVDRSVVNQRFSQGYSQGIQLSYTSDSFRVVGAFSDGLGTAGTDFNSGAESDYALTARFDFKIAGDSWNRFNDFTSWRSQEFAALVGGAIHWQDGGETGGTSDIETLRYTLDGSVEGSGWNLYGAFVGDSIEAGEGGDTDTFGGLLQGGVFVTDQVEIFARWDAIFLDDDSSGDGDGGNDDDLHFLAAGVNYYISPESHAVKFTGQVGYAVNSSNGVFFGGSDGGTPDDSSDDAAGFGSTSNGFLGQSEDGEFNIQLQMQVMF